MKRVAIESARLVKADPARPRCHTCGAKRRKEFWLNGRCLCEECVGLFCKNNPYVLQSKVLESCVGADQFGNFFVYYPGAAWHPRGFNGEGWPEDEQSWVVFESVTDGEYGSEGERYYDLHHSVQCRTVADARALIEAAQFMLERLEDEEQCRKESPT